MKLCVISPEGEDPRELPAVRQMLAAGLERYHVRKPRWTRRKAEQFLSGFTPSERMRIVVHQHPDLVGPLGLHGAHRKDRSTASDPGARYVSCACHDWPSLARAGGEFETVLLSPIFDSISKPGRGAAFDLTELSRRLRSRGERERQSAVIALGGINPANTRRARDLGFDGVAALGFVWQSADPVGAFHALRDAARDQDANATARAVASVGGVR